MGSSQTFHDSLRWDERFLFWVRAASRRVSLYSWHRSWSPAKIKIFPWEVYCSFDRCYHCNVSSHTPMETLLFWSKEVLMWWNCSPHGEKMCFKYLVFGHKSKLSKWCKLVRFNRTSNHLQAYLYQVDPSCPSFPSPSSIYLPPSAHPYPHPFTLSFLLSSPLIQSYTHRSHPSLSRYSLEPVIGSGDSTLPPQPSIYLS